MEGLSPKSSDISTSLLKMKNPSNLPTTMSLTPPLSIGCIGIRIPIRVVGTDGVEGNLILLLRIINLKCNPLKKGFLLALTPFPNNFHTSHKPKIPKIIGLLIYKHNSLTLLIFFITLLHLLL